MNKTQFKALLSSMPPLRHKLPGAEFDIHKSETVAWFLDQPGAKTWVWNHMAATRAITYDEASGTWAGTEFDKSEW